MPVTTRRPLEDQDPVVLELLRLATETILAHPGAVPPALYDLCDTWADDLASTLSRPAITRPREPTGHALAVSGGQAAMAGPPLPGACGLTMEAPVTTARRGQPR